MEKRALSGVREKRVIRERSESIGTIEEERGEGRGRGGRGFQEQ